MIALMLAAALTAQDPVPAECVEAGTTLEINDCFAALTEAERVRMDAYYAVAVSTLREGGEDGGEEAVAELEAGQKAWESYAELACAAVYTRWQAGTIRVVKALQCRRDLTRERTLHLWREYISFEDSTPPSLPEPTGYAARASREP
ncbi:lysozyme inhibitor LprI family protein [Brevundimonas fluminis]|jgi:uncharacterized protein YecT (DUF1311 family)|uniref:lysozyme inhibitor LprI family protein n=1 Tax=Brevundimonas fluminis TaxID=2487274 RepID=UPI000F6573EA|nr:lysozyme inhibitor LprI family protein [Brevundimonas fluminis]